MPGRIHLALAVTLGVGAAALCVSGVAQAMRGRPDAQAGAVIRNAEGRAVGSLRIENERYGKSRVTVTVTGLPAGYHGFHVHTKGACDPRSIDPATGSPFFSAGGHFNLGSGSHPEHSGDLPALLVGADGTGSASSSTDRFRVRQLLDRDGSAIMIHAGPDNQANIPDRYRQVDGTPGPDAETLKTGDSGARIACGVITAR
ncbi:superoxide dismutase family protein [Actinomadura sp. HBU206391]|uniref:superoxide dismutase family protein n=1 Tax=Actinomadura sp. HBU206391 TaxID=2731692 RepID=UPI00164FCBF8|nr:superoxide dismutase family protein [Actinomadura sp. HBU206391]MBC6459365.1 superoxide dismutase family protein [Actinomadura sp. HBU206391]